MFVRFSFSLNCINTLVFIEHSSSDQENIRKVNILNLHLEGVFGDESFGETRNLIGKVSHTFKHVLSFNLSLPALTV